MPQAFLYKSFLPLGRLIRRLLFLPERFECLPAGIVVGLRCFTIRIQKEKNNKKAFPKGGYFFQAAISLIIIF
jgi:hypothetical protein